VCSLPSGGGEKPKSPVPLLTPEDIGNISVDSVVLGIILIGTGLLSTFWGAKYFKICLFIAGAYLFALLAVFILQRIEPESLFSNRKLVYWAVTLSAALIGGFLLHFFFKLGVLAVGAFGGYCLAVYVLF
jgi:hypothetical protein